MCTRSSTWLRILSAIVAIIAILLYSVHNAAPYLRLECVTIGLNCPISKTYGTINDKDYNPIYLIPLKQIMASWIRNGYSTATQLSIFTNNKERLNIIAKDDVKFPNFDETSLLPIFSSTKNFGAFITAIAIQNGWIKSYNDRITDYWPKFPTKRIIISVEQYIKYYEKYSVNTSNLNMKTFMKFNKNYITIDNKAYYVKIKDILRHEAGFTLLLSNDIIQFNTTTSKQCCNTLENIKYLIYFNESIRSYHALSRGWILNEIFMRIEPNHRSMSDYFTDEIETKLSINDNKFILKFNGLNDDQTLINKMYHLSTQPLYWTLYHVILPLRLGLTKPFHDKFTKQICPSSNIMDTSFCPNTTLLGVKGFMDYAMKIYTGNIVGMDIRNSQSLSKQFVNKAGMSHFSFAGVSNAFSLSKATSYLLFSGTVINNEMLNKIISEPIQKLDVYLQLTVPFTQGGLMKKTVFGIDWYGWSGWGGSFLIFSPNYKTVIAFTVSAFASPHHLLVDEPRFNIILNLLSQQLLHDNL